MRLCQARGDRQAVWLALRDSGQAEAVCKQRECARAGTFLVYWLLQGVWVWVTLLPVVIVNSSPRDLPSAPPSSVVLQECLRVPLQGPHRHTGDDCSHVLSARTLKSAHAQGCAGQTSWVWLHGCWALPWRSRQTARSMHSSRTLPIRGSLLTQVRPCSPQELPTCPAAV